MPSLKTAIIILPLLTHLAAAQVPEGLAYSGQTSWDAATGIVTFKSSGTMPEENEALWWQVPSQVKRIVIEPNVTVRGGFRVPLRTPENPLHIVGGDRKSSVIFGTDSEPAQCALNLTVTGAEIGRLEPGIRRTRGTITINGRALPSVAAQQNHRSTSNSLTNKWLKSAARRCCQGGGDGLCSFARPTMQWSGAIFRAKDDIASPGGTRPGTKAFLRFARS